MWPEIMTCYWKGMCWGLTLGSRCHSLQEKHVKEKQVTHWKTVVKLQEKLKTVLNKVWIPIYVDQ